MRKGVLLIGTFQLLIILSILPANGAVLVTTELDQFPSQPEESKYYSFGSIPGISASDLAAGIPPALVGTKAASSGSASKLSDGVGANSADDPANNFFFDDFTTTPQVISFNLGALKSISQVNTYSLHHGNVVRAAQQDN